MKNLENLTIGEIRQIQRLFSGNTEEQSSQQEEQNYSQINEKVIVRTYSAGVHFGTLVKQENGEVYLKDARRLSSWQTNKGISLFAVAKDGLDYSNSRITTKVDLIWLQAIEIISMADEAIKSIESAPVAEIER